MPAQVMLADGSVAPLDHTVRQRLQAVIDGMADHALRCGPAHTHHLGILSC